MKLWLFVVGVFFLSSRGDGKRPELLDSSIWYTPNATLLNLNFDAAVVQMVCCWCCLSRVFFWIEGIGLLGFLKSFFHFFFFFFFDRISTNLYTQMDILFFVLTRIFHALNCLVNLVIGQDKR